MVTVESEESVHALWHRTRCTLRENLDIMRRVERIILERLTGFYGDYVPHQMCAELHAALSPKRLHIWQCMVSFGYFVHTTNTLRHILARDDEHDEDVYPDIPIRNELQLDELPVDLFVHLYLHHVAVPRVLRREKMVRKRRMTTAM